MTGCRRQRRCCLPTLYQLHSPHVTRPLPIQGKPCAEQGAGLGDQRLAMYRLIPATRHIVTQASTCQWRRYAVLTAWQDSSRHTVTESGARSKAAGPHPWMPHAAAGLHQVTLLEQTDPGKPPPGSAAACLVITIGLLLRSVHTAASHNSLDGHLQLLCRRTGDWCAHRAKVHRVTEASESALSTPGKHPGSMLTQEHDVRACRQTHCVTQPDVARGLHGVVHVLPHCGAITQQSV